MVTVYVGPFSDAKAGSRSLLARGLRDRGLPPAQLVHDARGRPFLPDGPWISLSHTAGAAAAAVADGPVGVDLERLRPFHPKLPQRVLSPAELEWFQAQGAPEALFFTLWTLKESYYKCLGTGLPGYPSTTDFYQADGLWRLRGSELRFFTWRKNRLFLAVCSQEQTVTIREES